MATPSAKPAGPPPGLLIRRNILEEGRGENWQWFLGLFLAVGISLILHFGLFAVVMLVDSWSHAQAAGTDKDPPLETIVKNSKKEEANVESTPQEVTKEPPPLSILDVNMSPMESDSNLAYNNE